MADVDLTPTAEMARNAARGLELRREHGRGGTEVGVARARDISNGKTLSPETVRRMHAFFSRHAKNKAGGEDDAGYIAWMLWGGDEGRDWASRKVDALDRKERNAMSDTRKAIMERLGMAAGGEKQVFASSDDIMEMAQMLSAVESAVMHKRIEEAKSLLRKIQPIVERNRGSRELDAQGMVRAYNDYRRKLGMSRPGAKAKMAVHAGTLAMAQANYNRAKRDLDEAQERLDAFLRVGQSEQRIAQAERGVALAEQRFKDAEKALRSLNARPGAKAKMGMEAKYPQAFRDAMQLMQQFEDLEPTSALKQAASDLGIPEGAEMRKFVEWANKRIRASRPGAKAKFGKPQFRVRKLHNGYLAVDVNQGSGWERYDTTHEDSWDGLDDYERGYEKAYARGLRWSGGAWRIPSSQFSRPGAKAKMATARDVKEAKEAGLRVGDIVRYKDIIDPDDRKWRARIVELRGPRLLVSNDVMPEFREWGLPPSTSVEVDEVVKASRPGAKVRAALADACWEGYEAVGTKPQDGKTVPNCVPKATAAKPAETPAMRELGRKMQELTQKADRLLRQSLSASVTSEQSQQMQDEVERISEQLDAMGEDLARQRKAAGFEKSSDLEREDVKAGLKLMAASDPAVSDKIRTLIKEGKPQDQAVAIALDMKRRGEL